MLDILSFISLLNDILPAKRFMSNLINSTSSASPPTSSHSLIKLIARKFRTRFIWRASRSRNARLTLVSQFFPPDFAATGQLLDDLTKRLSAQGLQVQVLTGMPAYAYNTSKADRIEFQSTVVYDVLKSSSLAVYLRPSY